MNNSQETKEFQGQATYMAKSSLDLGSWGARMSEEQKKEVKARLKNRLEKTYTLNFNKTESYFTENDQLDAMSGATDSWGKNFAAGDQYKNVKSNMQIQDQEFYGKRFLVKDSLQPIDWKLGSDTKQIGNYTCCKPPHPYQQMSSHGTHFLGENYKIKLQQLKMEKLKSKK